MVFQFLQAFATSSADIIQGATSTLTDDIYAILPYVLGVAAIILGVSVGWRLVKRFIK